ncbi:MAG: acetyl-CoA carboxylase biotin carboxyl carrier protein subunit [Bdellovibrionaceae bacterium]|nr:acetyl-CoA carboxylase biotin carboxyl carrier protein subunit [Bdellovibrio sp.]
MNTITLKIDGADRKVPAEVIDKKVWFKIDDRTFSYDLVELSQSSHVKTKSASKSPDKITAPMPGKMTKVFITEGQTVKKGDPLIVMEAMKMEYTLKSDINAQVEKVFVAVQQQVTLGHLLVQLKPEGVS